MVRRVVVGFDGSTGSEEALRDLAHAGLPDRLEACVLSVSDPAPFFHRKAGESAGSEAHRVLAQGRTGACLRLAEQACGMLTAMFPLWIARPLAPDGPASSALVTVALDQQADLLVVGAHGRSHCQQMPLGSCTRRVLMHSPSSVRIARPRRRLAGSNLRLLVAVDLSDKARARAAVAAVAGRSWPANTEVHLIAIVDGGADWRHLSPEATVVAWKQRHSASADGQACGALEEHWNVLRRSGCMVETVLFQGNGPLTLVRYATEWEADCVFVALPPERGASGSLAEDVAFITAACAPCSVEVARCPQAAMELGKKKEAVPSASDVASGVSTPVVAVSRKRAKMRARQVR